MKLFLLPLLGLASSMLSLQAAGTPADAEGAKDDANIKRYSNTFISRYSDKDFDRYVLPLGKALKSGRITEGKYEKSLVLEGRVTRRAYHSIEADRSTLELFRNYQQELTAAGFETLYLLEDGTQTRGGITFIDDAFTSSLQSESAETRYLSAKKPPLTARRFMPPSGRARRAPSAPTGLRVGPLLPCWISSPSVAWIPAWSW